MNEQDQAVEPETDDVHAALAGLATLEGLPVDEHVAVYEEIHATLRASLSRPAAG